MLKRKKTFCHLFCSDATVQSLWTQLNLFSDSIITLSSLTLQAVIFCMVSLDNSKSNDLTLNHLLLIFKLYIYKAREKHSVRLDDLIIENDEVRKMKKKTGCGE